eukprot:451632-Prorocentrum_minimum.AAC.1
MLPPITRGRLHGMVVKPLLSRCTTVEFNAPPDDARTIKRHGELRAGGEGACGAPGGGGDAQPARGQLAQD